ncbi:LysM peptidoglycan-binding domain-containing protein [Sinobaca sp. H24]|uniref:LysM peptidoglycan-binding domain-containing protein n=1 Tax=Sinobaca sp. H24 TaxID=2923376 RepID=UPI00207A6159|nr:LysM peptidoglycan-binding domain-containing protein [Sinobaca sp. H24]
MVSSLPTNSSRYSDKKRVRRKVWRISLASSIAAAGFLTLSTAGNACACSEDYRVQPGDTLYSIANKHKVTVEQLQSVNELHSYMIRSGQTLLVPIEAANNENANQGRGVPLDQFQTSKAAPGTYKVKAGDTMYRIARAHHMTVPALQQLNKKKSTAIYIGETLKIKASTTSETAKASYKVQPGDTMYSLASRFGTTVHSLKQLNNKNSAGLRAGESLKIPDVTTTKAQYVGQGDKHTLYFKINNKETAVSKAYSTNYSLKEGSTVTLHYTKKGSRPAVVSVQ